MFERHFMDGNVFQHTMLRLLEQNETTTKNREKKFHFSLFFKDFFFSILHKIDTNTMCICVSKLIFALHFTKHSD